MSLVLAAFAHEVELAAAHLDAINSAQAEGVASRLRAARTRAYKDLSEITD